MDVHHVVGQGTMRTTKPGINVGDPRGTSPVPGDLVGPQAGTEVYRLWDGSRERGGAARAIGWLGDHASYLLVSVIPTSSDECLVLCPDGMLAWTLVKWMKVVQRVAG